MTAVTRLAACRGRWKQGLRDGLQRGWLVLLPLALLPLVNRAAAPNQVPARAALVLAALVVWAATMTAPAARPSAVAVLAHSGTPPRLGPWEIALLAVAAIISVLYVVVAAGVTQISTVDGAYYYGVARHMALTGRFEEPIVWHFLHTPERIVHAPFDYWGCMTSLLLAPALALFGATPRTAFLTMSVLSAAAVLAFWYLISLALPLRYCATQLLALLIFAFSPPMDRFRFQPESTAIAQLFVLLSLIAFCRRRFVLALLSAFGLLLTRGDGVVLFSIIALFVVLRAYGERAAAPARWWRLALVVVACAGTYVMWSAVSFGTVMPPGPQRGPFLQHLRQAFEFGAPEPRSLRDAAGRFTYANLLHAIQHAAAVRRIPFTPAWSWWIGLSIVPLLEVLRHPGTPRSLIWILCFAGYFAMAWMAGAAFTLFRAAHTFVPLVVLAGAVGLDMILTRLHAWVEQRRRSPRRARLVGAGVLAVCAILLAPLPVLQTWPALIDLPDQHELPRLDPLLRGEPVASNSPWYMIAYTNSPAVLLPRNGEAAIAAVLERYAVRWLVIFPSIPTEKLQPTLAGILAVDQAQVGPFRLQRVLNQKPLPAVYRVDGGPHRR